MAQATSERKSLSRPIWRDQPGPGFLFSFDAYYVRPCLTLFGFWRKVEIRAEIFRSVSVHNRLWRHVIDPFAAASVQLQAGQARVAGIAVAGLGA